MLPRRCCSPSPATKTAHGLLAGWLGDPTARARGRVTLNPVLHLDPFGTLIMVVPPALGWARPVPSWTRATSRTRSQRTECSWWWPWPGRGRTCWWRSCARPVPRPLPPCPFRTTAGLAGPRARAALRHGPHRRVLEPAHPGPSTCCPSPAGRQQHRGLVLPERLAWRYLEMGRYGILIILAS